MNGTVHIFMILNLLIWECGAAFCLYMLYFIPLYGAVLYMLSYEAMKGRLVRTLSIRLTLQKAELSTYFLHLPRDVPNGMT